MSTVRPRFFSAVRCFWAGALPEDAAAQENIIFASLLSPRAARQVGSAAPRLHASKPRALRSSLAASLIVSPEREDRSRSPGAEPALRAYAGRSQSGRAAPARLLPGRNRGPAADYAQHRAHPPQTPLRKDQHVSSKPVDWASASA